MNKGIDKPHKRGRPVIRKIKLDATPQRVARAMFSAVKPPDPSRRIGKAKLVPKDNGDFERNG